MRTASLLKREPLALSESEKQQLALGELSCDISGKTYDWFRGGCASPTLPHKAAVAREALPAVRLQQRLISSVRHHKSLIKGLSQRAEEHSASSLVASAGQ